MKPYKLFATSLLISSCLFASTAKENTDALVTKAKQSRMMSIPENKTELSKLIDPNGTMITPQRVELGKKLSLEYFENQEDGVYLIETSNFFSIIEITNQEVKYRFNRIPKFEEN